MITNIKTIPTVQLYSCLDCNQDSYYRVHGHGEQLDNQIVYISKYVTNYIEFIVFFYRCEPRVITMEKKHLENYKFEPVEVDIELTVKHSK